jgi:hypothetical protein
LIALLRKHGSQFATKQELAVDLLGFQKIVSLDVDGVRQYLRRQRGSKGEGVDLVLDQEPMSGEFDLVEVGSERSGEVFLLVEVNGEGPVTCPGKADSQVESDRRFPTTTLCIGQSVDIAISEVLI